MLEVQGVLVKGDDCSVVVLAMVGFGGAWLKVRVDKAWRFDGMLRLSLGGDGLVAKVMKEMVIDGGCRVMGVLVPGEGWSQFSDEKKGTV
ncbi:hypothetical protein V6N12_029900 [Hibiscus sabdariffa]|uniref:Uncharacterized protein n=1 Tax=Hibiscus sabdariffa TaxID=183260 RepID=A0ABR2CXG2_9ROSI